jgi:small subunit ribosomal protein S5e
MAYLNVKTQKAQVFLPFTAGRYQKRSFQKVNCPIVERLGNSLMMKGRNNGKKQLSLRVVKQALEIIHLLTGENPLQVLIDALSAGGAREDSTRIGSGGTVRRQAVDVSPLRRVNQAIYLITRGSRESAFRTVKSVSECLADEIIACSKVITSLKRLEKIFILMFYRELVQVPTVMPSRRRMRSKELLRVTDENTLSIVQSL